MISYNDAWKTNWQFFTLLDRDWEYEPLTQEEIENTTLPDKFGWKMKNVSCLPLYTDRLTFFNGTFTLVDREHVWPISKGLRNKRNDTNKYEPYSGTDMHNLHMGDRKNNQIGHNNYPFGNVLNKSAAEGIPSSTTDEITGYLGLNKNGLMVYEPRDEDKGDIARSIFYMATCYHNFISKDNNEPALILVSNFTSTNESRRVIKVDETKDMPSPMEF